MRTRRWAPEVLSTWRHDRKAAAEVESDVDRIISVASSAGYALPRADAELVWLARSSEGHATWLAMENIPDEVLLRIIVMYTREP